MKLGFIAALLLGLCHAICFAEVRVAFFKAYDQWGNHIQLEPDGQFFHVAVQLEDGRWIHSHPQKGVELLEDLQNISLPAEILIFKAAPSIHLEDVAQYLTLPFDFTYSWKDEKSTYCSKLVGKILNIEPIPMSFSSAHWKEHVSSRAGEVGLSPDDIHRELLRRGFWLENSDIQCGSFLSPLMNAYKDSK